MSEWGVVNRIVPADTLRDKARAFARRLADGPTLANAASKRMIRLAVDDGVERADAAMADVGAPVMASRDLQNGARTLLEKGPGHASFEGR
jgi:enoyl-CoA hydratase